ncbi:periplasmic chaperone for outer membrane proteins SurA [Nitrosomonas nitrosa]|uniref:peptidylprolyl isomerase n=1 Tax=Nitrosomonas nitrosa TaxID=52442 RepID=UPI000D301211|nr:peptidylprolyl isomerase [Nitrosomonas nitrosa]PTR04567.1 periplasmic chaperone for outer membrane proteins SurA [Nitrosomonas nitrosa]
MLFFVLTGGYVMAQEETIPLQEETEPAQEVTVLNQVVPIDHIVAVVNEEVITRNELNDLIENTVKQLQKQGTQLPPYDVLEKQLLERLIMTRIQLQRAKEIGISVSDTELDQTLRNIAKENNLSMGDFYAALEQEGIGLSRFRDEIRDEMLMVRLKEREISSRVNVTEGEIDNFLRTQETSAIGNDDYHVAHILVQIFEQMDAAQVEAKRLRAEEALAKLQEGVEFAQVSAEFSDAPNALQGGDLGWRPIMQMGPAFAEMLINMQPGEVTPVIQSPVGFHILKLMGRRPQETPVVIINQTNARHILIKINELTSEDDAHRMIMQIKDRIDSGANFAETAKAYSEDASASSGGDLGWLSPGDTVREFEQAMDALLPGQISPPVRTQFGWHLIQVVQRRTQDVSEQQQRQHAHKAIHARKADMVMQEWLQQLRDQVYVEYRAEDI